MNDTARNESGMVTVNGVEMWWDVHGAGSPLVLLHPGGADSRAWDTNQPGLAEHFRTFRLDRRGQGRSLDPGGPITFDVMALDTIAFIETGLPIERPGLFNMIVTEFLQEPTR